MRSHGWSGNTPASDDEAIDRILVAAERLVDERGAAMRISDVAREIGVTRQTVYRYFPSTDALLTATAMRSADGFLDHLARRLQSVTDPVAALIEGLAFAIESLSEDSQIELVLAQRDRTAGQVSLTSDTALSFCRAMLHRIEVDWRACGFEDDAALDELAEFCLHVLHSFISGPGRSQRRGADLRRYLIRWVGPAIVYPRLASAMGSLTLEEKAPAVPLRSVSS